MSCTGNDTTFMFGEKFEKIFGFRNLAKPQLKKQKS